MGKMSKKLVAFFFSHKKFLKIFPKPIPWGHPLTFPLSYNHAISNGSREDETTRNNIHFTHVSTNLARKIT